MKVNVLLSAFFCSIALLAIAGTDAFAAIYKYVDKDGVVYFADDLQSVPSEYRTAVKIVSGEDKGENKGQIPRPQSAPEESKKPEIKAGAVSETLSAEKKENGDSFGSRLLISVIVVVSAVFAFVILRILDADHKKSVAVTRVVIIWGVSIFLLYMHAQDVIGVFRSFGNSIADTQQEAAEKGKKAGKAIKAINTLLDQIEYSSSTDSTSTAADKK